MKQTMDTIMILFVSLLFLRAKMETGQDVTDILDMSEVDSKLLDEQYRIFVETPLQEIIKEFDRRNMEVKGRFIQRNEEDSRKVGEDAEELFERLQDAPDMGLATRRRTNDGHN